jgi:hypothetical protein
METSVLPRRPAESDTGGGWANCGLMALGQGDEFPARFRSRFADTLGGLCDNETAAVSKIRALGRS